VDDGYKFTAPVGVYKPNSYGLYDMTGNVWEWVEDCYDPEWYEGMPEIDPVNECEWRYYTIGIIRGGSWIDHRGDLRISSRYPTDKYERTTYIGFRCARDPK